MDYQVPQVYYAPTNGAIDRSVEHQQYQQQQQQQQVMLPPEAVATADASYDSNAGLTSLDQYHFYNDPVISKWRRPAGPQQSASPRRPQPQSPATRPGGSVASSNGPSVFVVTPTGELRKQPVSILKKPGSPKTVTFSLAEQDLGRRQEEALPEPQFDRRQTRGAISTEEVAAAARAYQRQQQRSQSTFIVASSPTTAAVASAEASAAAAAPQIVVEDENQSVFYQEFSTADQASSPPPPLPQSKQQRDRRARARPGSRFEEVADESSDEEERAARAEAAARTKAPNARSSGSTTKSSSCALL